MSNVYKTIVERQDTEFQVTQFDEPEDTFGKRMLALVLLRLVEHLDPQIISQDNNKSKKDA